MITLKSIKFKNFLSVGNTFETVYLNKYPSVLIRGKNGQGKSLVIDAITFALFGKPFKKINKPQMVNSINGKNLEVQLEFSIGTKEYKVVRGIKPVMFEIWCDDILINQDSKARDYQKFLEESVLKLNYKSFTQIVVLGSASFVPFMQLTPNDRRIIIEDILDIKIFSVMKDIVKADSGIIKEQLENIANQLELTKEKIKIQQHHINIRNKDNQERIDELTKESDKLDDVIADCIAKNVQYENDIDSFVLTDVRLQSKQLNKLNNLKYTIENNINNHKTQKSFYENNSECPSCMQDITNDYKELMIEKNSSDILEMEVAIKNIDEAIRGCTIAIQLHNNNTSAINDIHNKITQNNFVINTSTNSKKNIAEEIVGLSSIKNNSFEDNLTDLQKTSVDLLDKKTNHLDDKFYTDIMLNVLNDSGIRTRIIDNYIPIINTRVNEYLSDMDFFANFELDKHFNETIKSRYRDEFSYNSFSEGEKKRIDIALLLTWRDIATIKNSVNINLLIMDEVFDSSLDELGVEDLSKLFYNLKNTNLFIISHRGDLLEDKFQNKIDVAKVKNFTVYKES